jgi:hypothetical protein
VKITVFRRPAIELCYALYKEIKESLINKGVKKATKAAAKEEKAKAGAGESSLKKSTKSGHPALAAEDSLSNMSVDDGGDDGSVGTLSTGPKKIGKREQKRLDIMRAPDNIILEASTMNELRPLHIAVQYDALECVKYLIDEGADVNAADFDGDTPLHKAAKFHNYAAYRMLVAAGADPNLRNNLKETPQKLLNWENTYLG